MPSRAVIARQSRKLPAPFIVIIFNLVKSLSKMKNTFKLSIFFIRYIKQILTAFYSGHSLIIGPWWCQNHDYALSFASGIVMVLTSPRAYNFNCAPQSSQYLYNIHFFSLFCRPWRARDSLDVWGPYDHYWSKCLEIDEGPNKNGLWNGFGHWVAFWEGHDGFQVYLTFCKLQFVVKLHTNNQTNILTSFWHCR